MGNQIQNKLFNYEVKPPEQAWDKIAAALDSDEEFLLLQKLYHFQETPSREVWENIKTRLGDGNKQDTAVPFFKKHRIPLRYTLAAASLILIVFLTMLPRKIVSNSNTIEDQYKTAQKDILLKDKKDSSAQTVISKPGKGGKNQTERSDHTPAPLSPMGTDEDIHTLAQSDRYVVYFNPTGDEVKVSKKLYDLFACSDFEIYCRQHIELLQQKVAASPSMASTDFNSVLDMLKSLQNNK